MTNRSTRVPASRRSQRARLSTGLPSASQSVLFVRIFVNAASASNGRRMRGLPNLAATAVRISRYGTRRPAELSGRGQQQNKEHHGTSKRKSHLQKGAHHGR